MINFIFMRLMIPNKFIVSVYSNCLIYTLFKGQMLRFTQYVRVILHIVSLERNNSNFIHYYENSFIIIQYNNNNVVTCFISTLAYTLRTLFNDVNLFWNHIISVSDILFRITEQRHIFKETQLVLNFAA